MLYLLSPYFNIFKYITLRSGGAFLTSFLICLIFGPAFIRLLKRKQNLGQPIRTCGPTTHLTKKGTPVMGGILIIGSIIITTLLWAKLNNPYILLLLGVLLSLGLLGFADDYLKLVMETTDGINPIHKIFFQFLIAVIACCIILYLDKGGKGTYLTFPFFKNFFIDLGYFYIPFGLIVIIGASNAVNLTDGLDGLVSFPVIMVSLVFMVIVYVVGRVDYAHYLNLYSVAGSGEIAIFCGAIIGALFGFLWYNVYPAKVFMGDTGSLALGGVLGTIALIVKHEVVLAIAGAIFVAEAISVILQVTSWRLRNKPLFLMAPLHHHFEKKGIAETTIVVRFWIISILLALIALSTLKLR